MPQQDASGQRIAVGDGERFPQQQTANISRLTLKRQRNRRLPFVGVVFCVERGQADALAQVSGKRKQPRPWTHREVFGRPLWDWLSLLLVPVLLTLSTILSTGWLTYHESRGQNALSVQLHQSDQVQHQLDERLAQQARWDDLLKAYRDEIDALLLDHGLRQAHPGDDVSEIAHARTLDILMQIDAAHKRSVLTYLSNLRLVQAGGRESQGRWRASPVVSLRRADVSGAGLGGMSLVGADLVGANMSGADLSRTGLTRQQLGSVFSLSGTTLPNGSKCKSVSNAEQTNGQRQAENRDVCLARWFLS
jgi:uncharacterized protein YjbI with pentapeptide repeats